MASPERYNTVCLLGAMDKLWFQKIVLSSESNKSPNSSSLQSQSSSSSNSSYTDCSDDDVAHESSSTISPLLPQNFLEHEDDHKNENSEEEKVEENIKPKRRRVKTRIRVLEKTVSCKTPVQLEEEEVKGFIDLGFKFDKDRITPNMISVVPGLQRLGGGQDGKLVVVAGEEEGERRKPYLSEAWVIKRPESPLLRLRIPNRVSPNAKSNDMKNHLKLWAKTVAYSALGDE